MEVGEAERIERSGALGHGDAVPGNGISHVVVVNGVAERSLRDGRGFGVGLVGDSAVDGCLDMVVLEEVRADVKETASKFLHAVVGQSDSTFLRQGTENFPWLPCVSWGLDNFVGELHSSFCVH